MDSAIDVSRVAHADQRRRDTQECAGMAQVTRGVPMGDGWTFYGPPPEQQLTDRVAVALAGFVHDCRLFARLAREAKLQEQFTALGLTWEEFCEQRLKHPAELVNAILVGVDVLGEDVPIPAAVAEHVGRTLRKHGGDRRSHEAKGNQVYDDVNLKGGHRKSYLLARLDRDHPVLAARVRQRELTPHAAARLAGIVKKKKTKTLVDQILHLWGKATAQEREQVRAAIELDSILTERR
jgi:hypothetical protein